MDLVYPVSVAPLAPGSKAGREMLPIVEPTGTVIARASRSWVHHGSKLLHPVVHLHIIDRYSRIYLQRRSAGKFLLPLYWDTAVGGHVLREYRKKTGDDTPSVIVATASPYKFAADVLSALTGGSADRDPFAASEEIERLTGLPMPEQVRKLRDLPVRHTAECDKDKMGQAVLDVMA